MQKRVFLQLINENLNPNQKIEIAKRIARKSPDMSTFYDFNWAKLAFGFSDGDYIKLNPDQISIKHQNDPNKAMYKASSTSLSSFNPVEVKFDGKNFWLEDGHGKYVSALKTNQLLDAKVTLDANPFAELGINRADQFYKQYHNGITTTEGMTSSIDDINNQIDSPSNIDSFAQKLADKLGYPYAENYGNGTQGYVFDIGDKIMKITADRTEAIESDKLIGKDNKHIANVFRVMRINKPYMGIFVIIREKLSVDEEKVASIFQSLKNTYNDDAVFVMAQAVRTKNVNKLDNFYRENYRNKDQDTDVFNAFKSLYELSRELIENNIRSGDFTASNFGFKPDGNLAYYDLGYSYSKRFTSPLPKIDINQ